MKPLLVVFDVAGTTLYDNDDVSNVFKEVVKEEVAFVSDEEIARVMGWSKPKAISELLASSGVYPTEEKVNKLHDKFVESMIDHYMRSPDVKELGNARNVFRQLRANGVKVGIDTGFSRNILKVIFRRLNWVERVDFDVSICADEVKQGRPHPDMIIALMKATGVTDPKDVVKVGDTVSDVLEGIAAGCGLVVGVLSGSGTESSLKKSGVEVIPDVSHVPAMIDAYVMSSVITV